MRETGSITMRGVRTHNLKHIDVAIPLGKLTVVAGVCGAGKSSLVFDTLHAEAQRRYLRHAAAEARQVLDQCEPIDADEIGALPPSVAIRGGAPAGATVASLADLVAPLRSLFARAGAVVCPECERPVVAHRTADVVAAINALPAGTRCALAFPLLPGEPGDQTAAFAALLEEGYFRIQAGGVTYRLGEQALPALPADLEVWVLLDRFEAGKTPRERLAESVEAAFRRGQGRVGVLTDAKEHEFKQRFVCGGCGRVFPIPTPPSCDSDTVRVGDRPFAEWQAMPIAELLPFATGLTVVDRALEEVRARLEALGSLDLGYLALGQAAAALSDGVARRIGLAAVLASNLVNVLFLIDEPSIGMHGRDLPKLRDALLGLRDRGNTVVVIEHERAILDAADHVIQLGPGAGEEGGAIVYEGPPADWPPSKCVLDTPTTRRKPTGVLTLRDDARDLSVEFPLGILCCITGVAGSGKRTLIERCLYPALSAAKKKKDAEANDVIITGAEKIADVILLDRAAPAKNLRGNPGTYLKIFDDIRALFSDAADAKTRDFGPGHFSFHQPAGRCETCEGHGTLALDLPLLSDIRPVCPDCHGRRYRPEILDIKVRGHNIAEVLGLTVREAFRFFRAQPAIERKLKVLLDVGLAHLRLGQALETLGGGECQRLKLAGHLASSKKGACLFLLLEPSAGLHLDDVATLLTCFDRLLGAGHSLIASEHDWDLIRCCDYVIEMAGGRVAATGTPEEVAAGDHQAVTRF